MLFQASHLQLGIYPLPTSQCLSSSQTIVPSSISSCEDTETCIAMSSHDQSCSDCDAPRTGIRVHNIEFKSVSDHFHEKKLISGFVSSSKKEHSSHNARDHTTSGSSILQNSHNYEDNILCSSNIHEHSRYKCKDGDKSGTCIFSYQTKNVCDINIADWCLLQIRNITNYLKNKILFENTTHGSSILYENTNEIEYLKTHIEEMQPQGTTINSDSNNNSTFSLNNKYQSIESFRSKYAYKFISEHSKYTGIRTCSENIILFGRKFAKYSWSVLLLSAILSLSSMAVKTHRRNQDWFTDEALYTSGVAISPAKGEKRKFGLWKTKSSSFECSDVISI